MKSQHIIDAQYSASRNTIQLIDLKLLKTLKKLLNGQLAEPGGQLRQLRKTFYHFVLQINQMKP
jgi:hypothetical protein